MAITLSRILSNVGHVTIQLNAYYCELFIVAGLGFELDLVSGWLVVMHIYLYYFPLSLSLSPNACPRRQRGLLTTLLLLLLLLSLLFFYYFLIFKTLGINVPEGGLKKLEKM